MFSGSSLYQKHILLKVCFSQATQLPHLTFYTSVLQSTVFTLTVSAMSILKKQDDDQYDWYVGGLSAGAVTLVMS